jgi:hypothetical protein
MAANKQLFKADDAFRWSVNSSDPATAPDYESGGQEFESLRARQLNQSLAFSFRFRWRAGLQLVCKLGSWRVLKRDDRLLGERAGQR